MHLHHRQIVRRICGLAAAMTAVALVGGQGLPAMAAPATAVPAAGVAAAAAPGTTTRQLLLVDGDQVVVRTAGGRESIAVRPGSRHYDLISLRFGGQVAEIPADAMPYLNRGLSPSLFLVSELAKAESGGRIPLQVGFTGHAPVIPGLTVTRSARGLMSGYLTAASAKVFGAALQRQFKSDHASGRFGSAGMFAGGASISLAGAPAAQPATKPAFPMHTLTVDGRNLQGKADTGDDVFVTSADSISRFQEFNETDNIFFHGQTKFSLPAGHYWALATFTQFTKTGINLRMVVVPQFTVAGKHSTLRIAEKSASHEVTVSAPLATVNQSTGFEIVRGARHGGPYTYSQSWSGLNGYLNTTTRKPTVGSLRTYSFATLTSPAGVSPGYAYNLDFPGPAGVIPPQTFAARPGSLATVNERYYQDVPTKDGGWVSFGGTVAQLSFELQEILPQDMPQVQTQYFSATPGLLWENQIFANLDQFAGITTDSYRHFEPGQQLTEDWNNYPLHPAPDVSLGGLASAFPTLISASRSGDTLNLWTTPFTDNQYGHSGSGYGANGNATLTGSYVVKQNGIQIAHGNPIKGFPAVKLGSAPSVISLTVTAGRWGKFFQLSPASSTTWTWHSTRNTTATVPAGWYCSFTVVKEQLKYLRQCAVQPMMTLKYDVQGMSLSGLTKPGAQVLDLTAGHIQLAGASAITGATAQVSYNDGNSWQPATTIAEAGGEFRVSYTAPAGVDVTLRVSATDAAGNSISETIVRAYGVDK